MQGRQRSDGWSYGQGTDGDGPSWDEVPADDGGYDPSSRPPSPRWDDWETSRQGNPYDQGYSDPRYSFAPPPPSYAYPPPVYAYPYGYPYPYRRPANPAVATAGGVLTLVSGALGIIWAALMFGDSTFFLLFGSGICAGISLVLSLLAVIGGIAGMMRRMFFLAIMGAICGMLSGGMFGISFLLALLGLIMMAVSKDAFSDGVVPPPAPMYRY